MADDPPVVIDAHTHAFPPDWIADRVNHCRRDRWFGDLYQAPTAKMIDAVELMSAMESADVALAIACGWPWLDPGLCREHNDYLADAAKTSNGCLAWLGIVAPASPGAAEETERCLALGASGIGELNADAQDVDIAQPGLLADVVEVLITADRPLLLHASEPVGHRYPGKGTATPDRLLSFLAENPNLRVVLAHWGGGLPFYELMPEVAALTGNVVYDSAASTYLYRFEIFPTVLSIVGSERVRFASDYPVLTQPRFVRRVRNAGISPSALGEVLGENAERVFRLTSLRQEATE